MPSGGQFVIQTCNQTAAPEPGSVTGSVPPGEYVSIQASDTGEGIPAEIRDQIFEPFFTTKSVDKGSGLGLSQVYGFVRQSGGYVKLTSQVGPGTAVTILLPRARGRAATAAPAVAEQAPVAGGRESILVVEDSRDVLDVVVGMLDELGYRVTTAADATEAVRILRGIEPLDLVFSDIVMPGGMSGQRPRRVLIVEDEALIMMAAVDMLNDLGHQTFTARNAADAVAVLRAGEAVNVMLTDINLPDMNGEALATEARRLRPNLPVVFATGHRIGVPEALGHSGPMAVLGKPYWTNELEKVLRQVC